MKSKKMYRQVIIHRYLYEQYVAILINGSMTGAPQTDAPATFASRTFAPQTVAPATLAPQ